MRRSDRVWEVFGTFSSSLRIQRFKRENTCRTEPVQLSEILDQPNSLAVGVSNCLAANFPKGRCVSGFEVLLNGSPIFRKLARLARITHRNLAQSLKGWNNKDAQ